MGRFEFNGDYRGHNCSIRFKGLRLAESGEWWCGVQSYSKNSFWAGRMFQVKVEGKDKMDELSP